MDKYDLFLRDIIEKTQDESLSWKNVSPSRYSDYIFQSVFAYQAFACDYISGKREYRLVLVHKKVLFHHPDLDILVDKHVSELLVLQDGILLITLNDDYVDAEDLLQLCLLVEEKSSQTKQLFAEFDVSPSDAADLNDKETGIPGR